MELTALAKDVWQGFEHASVIALTLLWWRSLSYRNQSIDLQNKSIYWFLYDRDLRHERINVTNDVINPFQPGAAFYIKTSYLIWRAKQILVSMWKTTLGWNGLISNYFDTISYFVKGRNNWFLFVPRKIAVSKSKLLAIWFLAYK